MALRSKLATAVTVAFCGVAAPADAIVGGQDASPGEYPAVAKIAFGPGFQCTGTLVAPNWVLSAGHCSSLTGVAVGSPVAWPASTIDVRIGGHKYGEGERVPVKRVLVNPNYTANVGYDVALLELSRNATKAPVKVAGPSESATWSPGTMESIVGWGVTEEGGDQPDVLQEAQVPITTDAYCAGAYSDFDPESMVCAGFPQGGVDTCQGDSGGPMFGRLSGGTLRVVGATSFGEGCARAGKPGVYARVGDSALRNWIASHAPAAIGG